LLIKNKVAKKPHFRQVLDKRYKYSYNRLIVKFVVEIAILPKR
jgi:hypothetical protein